MNHPFSNNKRDKYIQLKTRCTNLYRQGFQNKCHIKYDIHNRCKNRNGNSIILFKVFFHILQICIQFYIKNHDLKANLKDSNFCH